MTRVLVVDDEPRIVSFVSRALAAEGLGVDSASDGARGLELALGRSYDLVVLDLLLPRLDGREVLRQLLEARPEQRVLVLSAVSEVDSRVACLDLGASDYLPKPFAIAELVARVRARLRQPGAPALPRILAAGRLTLDVVRRRADSSNGSVPLTEREFQLLQHLMRREGEVCTREELLADAWNYSFDPQSNVVEVYVARLRAKLGADLIETVRNVGYRLDAP
ncbi:MAG: response regulator transcription factor [Chloroflexota bacterium]|nr:MAG: response regulator transcription factor [Chloroflexota bacterium]